MTNGEGRLIGKKYRLREILGEGGLGVVWRAYDETLDRDVAIKEVRPRVGIDTEQVTVLYMRTLREARAAAKLTDPGIVVVHEVVHEDDRPWIVMELVSGRTLEQIIAEDGRQTPQRTALLGGKILMPLRAVHRAGIVHRDIKPSNIMFDGERTVLTDFGIAALDGSTVLTMTGAVLGTPAFMSPEQAHGRKATPASDLWSLGATLYATVEGRPPFEGESVAAVIAALLANRPLTPEHAGPLAPVIAGLMVTDPERRMSADEVAVRLARIASGEDTGQEAGQSMWPGASPGIWPGVGQGIWPGSSQGVGPGASQATGPSASHGIGAGASHGIRPGSGQAAGPGASHGIGAGAGQVARPDPRHGLGTGASHGIGAGAGHGIGTDPSHGVETDAGRQLARLGPQPPTAGKDRPSHWNPFGRRPEAPLHDDATVLGLGRPPARVLTALAILVVVVVAGTITAIAAWPSGHSAKRPVGSHAAKPPSSRTPGSPTSAQAFPLVRLSTKFASTRLGTGTNIFTLAYSPDGKTLAAGGSDDTILLWDTRRRVQTAQIPGHSDSVEQVAFSPDSRQLATCSNDKTIRLWDLRTGAQIAKFTGHTDKVWSVDFSPDGKTLASGSKDGTIRVWDVASRKLLRVVRGHTDAIVILKFSPDGKTLASGSWDDTVRLWDTTTWRQTAVLRGHTDAVHGVVFSPDGKTLASGAEDGKVLLWNLATHAQTAVLTGDTKQVWAVAFSPDGRTLASGGTDNKIFLLDATTATKIATLSGHKGQVDWLAFSPDGKTLASGGEDKSIRLWDLTR